MDLINPEFLITNGGLLLVAFIVFAESGLLFGFFLPGDTLLLLTGIIASSGKFSILTAVITIVVSAILGGISGYYIGKKFGPKLFKKSDGILFKKEYIKKSEDFYEKHGNLTIILARFLPIVRTFVPVLAGVGNMNVKKFGLYNAVGGVLWGAGVTLVGYFFGKHIPNIEKLILPVVLSVVVLSFGPTIYHLFKNSKTRSKL